MNKKVFEVLDSTYSVQPEVKETVNKQQKYVQSNAPRLEYILQSKSTLSATMSSRGFADDFATPSKRKTTKKNNQSEANKFKQKADEFATPRISNIQKSKVIVKEKLNIPIKKQPEFRQKAEEFATPRKARLHKSERLKNILNERLDLLIKRGPCYPVKSLYSGSTTYVNSPTLSMGWADDTEYTQTTSPTLHTSVSDNTTMKHHIDDTIADFEALTTDPNTTLDTTSIDYRTRYDMNGKYNNQHSNQPFSSNRYSEVDNLTGDMTQSVSALSIDAPTVATNYSDPGLSNIYNHHSTYNHQPPSMSGHRSATDLHHNIASGVNRPPGLRTFNSFEHLPTSGFQAASFGQSGASMHNYGSGLAGTSSLPYHPSLQHHRTAPFNSTAMPGAPYQHNYPTSGMVDTSEPYGSADVTHWQHQHQQQLHRQQAEVSGGGNRGPSPTQLTADPHRLVAIKQAADNIIKEKDNIIDRQKLQLLELERRNKDAELEMQKTLLKKVQKDGDVMSIKLQPVAKSLIMSKEAQYQSASFKAQLNELMSARNGDLQDMEKKLAATEYELEELKKSLNKEIDKKKLDIKEMEGKLGDKDGLVSEYKEKYMSVKKENEELQVKVASLERYMSDLPTLDDQSKTHSEIRTLREDKHKYKQRSLQLEKKNKDLQKGITSRDGLIESLEQVEKQLREELDNILKERDKLASDVQQLRHQGKKIPEEEMVALAEENLKLKAECEKAKKLVDGQYRKLQHLDSQHKQQVAQLEERLYQDESSVTALRQDIEEKEQNLAKLRVSAKQLGSQNQDLMEQNIILNDKIKHFEKQYTGEPEKVQRHLLKEMAVCFSELQSLVQICVQQAEGQDPNISVLLGVKANAMVDLDSSETTEGTHSLKHKVTKVKELREEIDKLRALLSNKYAEDIGENLNCTHQ